MLSMRGRFVFVVFALAALCAPAAQAQVSATSPQQLNPAGRVPSPEEAKQRQGDILAPPEAGPCPFRDLSLSFVLTSVSFTTPEKAPYSGADALAPTYQEMVGQKVPLSAVCDIRDRAAEDLFHRGILARVDIPKQTISKGAVQLVVTEAYVAAVEVHGLTSDLGPAEDKVEDYTELLKGMKPFDINKAQRYLFLASDIPGVQISAVLRSAKQGPGAVILDITVRRTPVSGVINVQNYNSSETGPWGGTARVDFNSFTDLGERTSLIGYSTPDYREEHVFQGIEEVRLGDEGLIASASFSYGSSKPGGDLAPLHLGTSSYVGEFNLSYPLLRARRANLNVEGGFDVVDQIVDTGAYQLSHDGLRVFYAKLDGNESWRFAIPVSIGGDLEYRQGAEILGASNGGDFDLSRYGGQPGAWNLRAQGDVNVQWLPYFGTNLFLTGQYTDQRLLAYEDFTVGNLTVVRGYDPSAVTGDRGIGGSIQGNLGGFPVADFLNVAAFGFFDMARVSNLDVAGENQTLRSAGAGINFDLSAFSRWQGTFTYAHPLDPVSKFVSSPPSDEFLFSLSYLY